MFAITRRVEAARRQFRVGEWLVEPDLNRITKGNREVGVEPKVLEVLICLAEVGGQVLSKEKIVRTVWPDTYVSDGILSYSISELRRAFGDDARNPHIIETIPRKGYRLIAPVSALGPPLRINPSIAVLPFTDLSLEKDQDYFCDGITAEIISNLAHMSRLRIASRTSTFEYKGKAEDVRTIGRKLGVDMVLEGSVRKAGNRLRIAVQLTKVEDGCHLWAERYDRELRDVFAIQDDISRSIATTLKITISPEESHEIGKAPTHDIQAFDFYLRGRQYFHQYSRKGIEFALRMFFHAIAIDPAYARAHAGIADCCVFLYLYAGSHKNHLDQADSASQNAIDLDSASAEAHASRGNVFALKGDFESAEMEFQTAILLNPTLFEAYYCYARAAFASGRMERAVELYEKACEVNPRDYQAPLLVAQICSDIGREEDAAAARRRGVRLAEERLQLNPDDARALYMGANGLVALGEHERGLEWGRQAMAIDPDEPMLLYNVACIQALAGRVDDALDSLERAIRNGLTQKNWLEKDSNLDSLRRHPRYPTLLELIGQYASCP